MPALIPMLWGAFLSIIGSAVGRGLVALGIGVATYSGLDVSLGFLKDRFVGSIDSLPPQLIGLLGLMQIGVCFSIISSAVVMKLTIAGMNSGTVKRWVKK